MQLSALLVDKERNRNAPGALARNAPIRPPFHHTLDPGAPPVRRKLGFTDLFQRCLAQPRLLHADEPLRRCAEDDRRLVTPAVRVAV